MRRLARLHGDVPDLVSGTDGDTVRTRRDEVGALVVCVHDEVCGQRHLRHGVAEAKGFGGTAENVSLTSGLHLHLSHLACRDLDEGCGVSGGVELELVSGDAAAVSNRDRHLAAGNRGTVRIDLANRKGDGAFAHGVMKCDSHDVVGHNGL